MEELTKKLEGYLGSNRDCTKEVFKMVGSIYRGVNKGRFSLEKALLYLNKKEGAVNER